MGGGAGGIQKSFSRKIPVVHFCILALGRLNILHTKFIQLTWTCTPNPLPPTPLPSSYSIKKCTKKIII